VPPVSGTREWDAGTYDRVSAPQLGWGRAVLERLRPAGDETVIDAGCGSGRVTELLVGALPEGRVVAVDGSRAMLGRARERLAPYGDRVELIHSDLLELELPPTADAVFSSATFHWIGDHVRLFRRVESWLRAGGRLEAQCGGEGNIAAFLAVVTALSSHEPYAAYLRDPPSPHLFADPGSTAERLTAAGFERIECSLEVSPETPPDPRAYIEAICLGPVLSALPEELSDRFVGDVMDAWGPERQLDYVRLNISARKGPAG
jgi:trans-aconitate 2-methyltransferase